MRRRVLRSQTSTTASNSDSLENISDTPNVANKVPNNNVNNNVGNSLEDEDEFFDSVEKETELNSEKFFQVAKDVKKNFLLKIMKR